MNTPRRRFLCAAGAAFGSVVLSRLGADLLAAKQGLAIARREGVALGSTVSMTALHANQATAKAAIEEGFAALEEVESVMSIYRASSQVSRLNRTGILRDPHPDLVAVLGEAQRLSKQTDGAFDITVQPLWSLFNQAKKQDRTPLLAETQAAQSKIDWRRVEIDSKAVRLREKGTQITLNGIAQGFAADKACAAIRQRGVEHALIDTGEIGTLGDNANTNAPWTIGIQHPRVQDAYISLAKLAARRLATSGDYATTFSDDFSSHHLFDPRTGRSAASLCSVTITADTALQADALSTAVFVLGPEAGAKLIESTPGADGLLVLKTGRVLKTAGFPS